MHQLTNDHQRLFPEWSETHKDIHGRRRASVDLRGCAVSDDVLVALLDRPQEMQGLVNYNRQFYSMVEHFIKAQRGQEGWAAFQHLLFAPRHEIPDREWIAAIGRVLEDQPVYFNTFKEIVGYDDFEDEQDSEEGEMQYMYSSDKLQPPLGPLGTMPEADDESDVSSSNRGLLELRAYPAMQERLSDFYPGFFQNAQRLMSLQPASALSKAARRNSLMTEDEPQDTDGSDAPRFNTCEQEQDNQYVRFAQLLCTTRRQQPDDEAWLAAVTESLDDWPELMDDLRDIAMSLGDQEPIEAINANV